MKTNSTLYIIMIMSILCLSSCDKLIGDGPNVIYKSDVNTFTSLDINIPCDIDISYADSNTFNIEAQQNIIDNIDIWEESNTLHVEFTQKAYDYNPITLIFKMPVLKGVSVSDLNDIKVTSNFKSASRMRFNIGGTSNITFTDTISCTDFLFESPGVSTLNMDYLACSRKFDVTSSGKATIHIKGKAQSSYISASDYMTFNGLNFETENTNLTIEGKASFFNINVSNKLAIDTKDGAEITYAGNPLVVDTSKCTGTLIIRSIE